MGDASRTSGEGLMYSNLHDAGWLEAAIMIVNFDDQHAIVSLRLSAGHVLRVLYSFGSATWQPLLLLLLGETISDCELPPAMQTENITRIQAEAAALSIPDIPLLKASILLRLQTVPQANAGETVEEIANLDDWTRERLFLAAAWLMANGWPTAGASISAESEDDHLRRLIKFALRVDMESYLAALGLRP